MCGIAAILAPAVDASVLGRIGGAMAARGPDGAGQWLSPCGSAGLAHRRLSIIDLSAAAAQPMAASDRRLHIVFNGEIYNYRELRAELQAAGAAFRSTSDTEVLLELYRRFGRDMLPRLRGMFAFALWDVERRSLLLARDPFGIKPLYLSDDGKVLQVASQVKALLAGGAIDTRPDPAGHAGFFLWGHVPEPHTLYRGIRALPAGGWLWATADGGRTEGRFFDLPGELSAARAGAGVGLREALVDSVRAHLIADVPVGVFLSGGLDSTTLAALASEAATVKTVTLGFDEFAGSARDEVPLAQAVARQVGSDHLTRRIRAADFAAARDGILAAMDQPSIDGVNTWLVARAARECGLKVALSGVGGDELFGGYDTFRRVPRLAAWPPLGAAGRGGAPCSGAVDRPGHLGQGGGTA